MSCRPGLDVNSLRWQPSVQILNYVCLKEMICCNSQHSTCVTSALPRQRRLIAQAGIRYWSEEGGRRQWGTGSVPPLRFTEDGGGGEPAHSAPAQRAESPSGTNLHTATVQYLQQSIMEIWCPLCHQCDRFSLSLEHLESSRPIHGTQ